MNPPTSAPVRSPDESRARIICLEGLTAVGKTTLAAELARTAGAAVVPELDASGAPPVPESAAWFVDRHAEQWRRARALAERAPLVVVDCDPFKGLWYNQVFADQGWPDVRAQAPLYRAHVTRGTLAFPDLYVVLVATEAQLRARRAGDATRSRRNFEAHLRLTVPHRHYYQTLRAADPARVLLLDTTDRDTLAGTVLAAVERLPAVPPDSARLFEHMVRWVAPVDER
jgi:thymidylate kinase